MIWWFGEKSVFCFCLNLSKTSQIQGEEEEEEEEEEQQQEEEQEKERSKLFKAKWVVTKEKSNNAAEGLEKVRRKLSSVPFTSCQ